MTYPDEREAVMMAAIYLLHRAGGSATFDAAEWKTITDLYGPKPHVLLEDVDHTVVGTVIPRKLRLASTADARKWQDEAEHKRLGHAVCSCGNWIAPIHGSANWYHIGNLGDDIPIHFASPA